MTSRALLIALLALAVCARADVISQLSAADLKTLKSGQMVVQSKDMPTGGWPQVTVYTKIDAPVSVVEEVLRDYDHAQDFQSGLVSAKVVAQPSPDVCDVEYTSKMPIFGTMAYTVQNTFSNADGGFGVSWKLLKSTMADISDGSLRVEPYEGGSIMRYTNYVKPKSAIAVVAKGAALGEVKKTVSELKAEAERRAH